MGAAAAAPTHCEAGWRRGGAAFELALMRADEEEIERGVDVVEAIANYFSNLNHP